MPLPDRKVREFALLIYRLCCNAVPQWSSAIVR